MSTGPHDDATRAVTPYGVPTPYTDADALAIWARAARLQAEADAGGAGAGPAAAASEPAATPVLAIAEGTGAPAGIHLREEIIAAGRAAGIDEHSLRIALAEHEALGRETAVAVEAIDEAARQRHLGQLPRSVRVSRVVPEAPATVLARLREVIGEAPWSLAFDGVAGAHPEHGGVLRFRVPVIGAARGARPLTSFIYHASRVGMAHLHVTLAPRGTDALPGCEITVTGDVRAGERVSLRMYRALDRLLVGAWGVAGAIAGGAAGDAALASVAIGGVAGVAAALGFSRLTRGIARWEHRTAHRRVAEELDALLRRVQRPGEEARAFAPVRPTLVRHDEPGRQPMRRAPVTASAG